MVEKLEKRALPSVSVVGMGYVGLCTAACLANRGFRVYGVEVDKEKCEKISSGVSPIHEPGLDSLLRSTVNSGMLSCEPDYFEAMSRSGITFLTVGTPSMPSGEIDLRFIESAAKEVGRCLAEMRKKKGGGYHVVAVKSTVIPGTTEGKVRPIIEAASSLGVPADVGLCVNPEFLREGTAIEDTMEPDAIIIGSSDARAVSMMKTLFRKFYWYKMPPMITLSSSSAEFVKYSINTFRATQLSFLNTLANLTERVQSADVDEVIRGLSTVTGLDRRYLRSGLGFGGSCLPKDVRALIALCRSCGVNPSILEASLDINETQPLKVLHLARRVLGDLSGKRIAVLGLAFKAGTDDVRESVAIRIANALSAAGAQVSAFDPRAMMPAKARLDSNVALASEAISCIRGSDLCVIATEWDEFRRIQPSVFLKMMRNPLVIDGKRLLDQEKFSSQGVEVIELGRYLDEQTLGVLAKESRQIVPLYSTPGKVTEKE